MRPGIIAVDPGGVETGIILRRGDELLFHATVKERDPQAHVAKVLDAMNAAVERVLLSSDPDKSFVVAVEDVSPPNPHLGMTNVRGLLGTARVVGAVFGRWQGAGCVVVPPGGNGSGPLTAYPSALRPTRGSGRGKDGLRHCRSAYDVAGAAEVILRQRRAS